jgi:uncharacterized peroxidase-related enzyme
MSRIHIPPSIEAAPREAQPLLQASKAKQGRVPNMLRLIATSPIVLWAYLGFGEALDTGNLDGRTRQRIALAVAQLNGCDYCLSAHIDLAKHLAKLDDGELAANRQGRSTDRKADAAVRFAATLVRERGRAGDDDISALRSAGYSDGEILEIIAHVALNIFTNYVNEALGTEIDFPVVRA